jgi:hypothetical protein
VCFTVTWRDRLRRYITLGQYGQLTMFPAHTANNANYFIQKT